MTKRKRALELARSSKSMPGGPTGELHERERVLELIGVQKIQAPRAVWRRSREGHMVSFRALRERSAKRAAALGWVLIGDPPRWQW